MDKTIHGIGSRGARPSTAPSATAPAKNSESSSTSESKATETKKIKKKKKKKKTSMATAAAAPVTTAEKGSYRSKRASRPPKTYAISSNRRKSIHWGNAGETGHLARVGASKSAASWATGLRGSGGNKCESKMNDAFISWRKPSHLNSLENTLLTQFGKDPRPQKSKRSDHAEVPESKQNDDAPLRGWATDDVDAFAGEIPLAQPSLSVLSSSATAAASAKRSKAPTPSSKNSTPRSNSKKSDSKAESARKAAKRKVSPTMKKRSSPKPVLSAFGHTLVS